MFVSFFYQLGKDGGLAFNNMWDAINRGDARAAHDEALDSLWAKQTPKRAKRFANMLLENV
jgi:lysozyme